MIGPLGYLAGRSARNRLVRQLRRLRTPRYALALLLGIGYLWAVAVYQRPTSRPPPAEPESVQLIAAIGVTLIPLWTWIFGADRRSLGFTRAEVTWLFPAPLLRSQLIQYKLVRGQAFILFNVLLWTFFLSRGWASGEPWRRAGALWILLTTLSLHRLGVALLRGSLVEHGRAALRARIATLAVVALVFTALLVDASRSLPALGAAWGRGFEPFTAALREVASQPVASGVLFPARLLIRPLMVGGWPEWFRAIGPALAILLLHYAWVIRSDAAFEESAAAAALVRQRDGRRGRTPRVTARPIPQLNPGGWPAAALLWKNLALVVRTGPARGVALGFSAAVLAILGLAASGSAPGLLEAGGWFAATWAALLFVLGPQWVRNDLRADLPRLALLRSYPLRGRTVVAVEAAGSAVVMTVYQLCLVTVAYIAFRGADAVDPSPELRNAILPGAFAFLPGINFLSMLIQNGAALIFPAWMHLGAGRPIGIEALGHNMLVMIGFTAVLAVLLVVPVGGGALLFLGLERTLGWWAMVPAGIFGLAAAGLEARLLVSRLGRVFERTDPGAVPVVEMI